MNNNYKIHNVKDEKELEEHSNDNNLIVII